MKGSWLRIYTATLLTLFFVYQQSKSLRYIASDGNQISHTPQDDVYTTCLEDVLQNLPLGPGRHMLRKKMHVPDGLIATFAHHYDAGNRNKWNHKRTFDVIDIIKDNSLCSIWEIGAHEAADQSRQFLSIYPHCTYHAYEPIPIFHEKLQKNWADETRMVTHNYGLGKDESTFTVPLEGLKGQSTFLADFKNNGGDATDQITAVVKSFDFAIEEAGGKPSLIHMNCEGCE